MLIYLLSSVLIWWDFNDTEFEKKKENSFNMPVFVVCYSHYCPHCSGLPEGTRQYSDGVGNRTDMYVTMIDCATNPSCRHFHIRGTPHMVLVFGPSRKYWPRVYIKDGNVWNTFIDKYLNTSLRRIETDDELIDAKNEPADGGTTFHLETPNEDNKFITELKDLSRKYQIYNDTFTYRLNSSISEPILTAYPSPFCEIVYKTGSIENFVDDNKFGSRHQYDVDEYKKAMKKTPLATIFVEESLNGAQKYALKKMPTDFCKSASFGYVSLKESKNAMSLVKLNKSELPLFVYQTKKCKSVYKGRILNSYKFLSDAVKKKLCGSVVNDSDLNAVLDNNIESDDEGEQKAIGIDAANGSGDKTADGSLLKNVSGMSFMTFYIFGLLFVILAIRLISNKENKEE